MKKGQCVGKGKRRVAKSLHRIAHAIVRELLAPPPRQPQTGGEVLRGFNLTS